MTRYTHDVLGRLTKIEQQGDPAVPTTTFTYDARGNVTSVTLPNGQTTTFTYDLLSRLVAETQPLGQVVRYAYDDLSRLDYKVNARGQKTDYTYHPWGALAGIDYYPGEAAPTPTRSVTFGYNLLGQLTDVTAPAIYSGGPLYSYTYDAVGRRQSETAHYIPGGPRTLTYGYDRWGNLASLVLSEGGVDRVHTYTHDKLNRLADAVLPGTAAHRFGYEADDRLRQIQHPNGVTTTYGYDTRGLLKSLSVVGGGGALEALGLAYDGVGNLKTLTAAAGASTFGYDGLDRLTSATYPGGLGLTDEAYAYDPLGNREDPVDPALWEYDANNRITASPGLTYGHDADGNLTSRSDGAVLTYNEDNRLTGFSLGSTTASYTYDPFGRRIGKSVNGVATWYLWAGTRLVGEYDAGGVPTVRYGHTGLNFAPVQVEMGGRVYQVHTDYRDAPVLLTDAGGTVVWKAAYQAFGRALIDDDPDGDGTRITFNVRLPGQYEDAESGFYYNYFRYYDPALGRYITSDPIGLAGGLNGFGYASSNPLRWTDSLGLTSDCSYYERRCKEVPDSEYYCDVAPFVCKNWPDDPWDWDGCVRQCLQDRDCPADPCGGADLSCIARIHAECWTECLRNR